MSGRYLFIFLSLCFCFACGGKTSSNLSNVNSNEGINPSINSNINSNINLLNTSTIQSSERHTEVSPEMLKQIEAQQKESKRLAEEKMKSGETKIEPTNSNANSSNVSQTSPNTKGTVVSKEHRTF